ncbi:HipA domain-containing protein [Corynebacterium hindlerae]|uniref:HipA domain-containing protein n=1 Tax=Corynebacterium hindlerae TaxID=699041 RepID=A0A7G5FF83_9CORY|nr:HipA domain-containing protein [Corynebacterium hindlerae]
MQDISVAQRLAKLYLSTHPNIPDRTSHAKNVSILQQDGRWDVAPMYDVPCTAFYRDFTMALPVNGKTKDLKRQDWLDFAHSIGLPPAAAAASIRLVLGVVADIDLSLLPFTGSPLTGAERELRHRRYQVEE